MKIGIDTLSLGTKSTGTKRYLECLLEQLEESNNKIVQLSPPFYSTSSRNFLQSIRKNWYRNFGISKALKQSSSDWLIFPDYFMPAGLEKPVAVVIHDLSFITHPQSYSKKFVSYYTYMIKKTAKQKPIIVTVSEHSKKNIIRHLGVDEKNILLVQGYSRIFQRQDNRIKIDECEQPYFLYVGHIEPRKNLTFLIEGFLKWKERQKVNYKLKIVGELWIKSPEIMSLMKKYNNTPNIEFTGYISEQKLDETYRNSSAFVHASFEEGFGFPVLEAMQYNLPILCTQGTATQEISSPNSIVCDPYDAKSLQNGFNNLHELVLRNQKVYYDIRYTPNRMKEQLNELLDIMELRLNKKVYITPAHADDVDAAIEKTFVYSSLFNSGIKKDKIHRQVFDLKINQEDLEFSLYKLLSAKILIRRDDAIYLNNLQGFYNNKDGIKRSKINRIFKFLKHLPLTSSIAFSGGSAHYGCENHNDLDLFIITKPNTVYIVYFLIHLYSIMFNLRKELCANYLVDETNLQIDDSLDFYTAHQIISLTPFKNENMLYRFWNENTWVRNFFPNFIHVPQSKVGESPNNFERFMKYSLLVPFNKILMLSYKFYYLKKLKVLQKSNSLKLTDHCMKLHTNNNREKIIMEFEKTWSNYLAKKPGKKGSRLNKLDSQDHSPLISMVNKKPHPNTVSI
jgi:glycosyltransferase involved in cell wall biosynthesis